tara:strand:- start:1197 stop:1601 length:405 start_codon:yes stop_codon:yes gene_type:complete
MAQLEEWDFTNIENSDEVCWKKVGDTYELSDVTLAILRASALTGVADLNPKTLGTFLRRIKILIAAGIPKQLFEFTRAEAEAHLGLTTIAKRLDDKGFKNQVWSSLEEIADHIETKFGEAKVVKTMPQIEDDED